VLVPLPGMLELAVLSPVKTQTQVAIEGEPTACMTPTTCALQT